MSTRPEDYGVEVRAPRADPYTQFATRLQMPGENPQQEFVRGVGASVFPTPRDLKAQLAQLLGTAFGLPDAWDSNQAMMEALPQVPAFHDADEALRGRLVAKVLPPDELLPEARRLAKEILGNFR